MEPFTWIKTVGGFNCEWNRIHLFVSDGTGIALGWWQVYPLPAVYMDPRRIDADQQTIGKDVNEAKQRAQAAAMALHQKNAR